MYRPRLPFNVPARIIPMLYEKINGVTTKKSIYGVVVSVLNGTRAITVYQDGNVSRETLWVKTRYKSTGDWVEGIGREITGTYTSSYNTKGIIYEVRIFKTKDDAEPLCEVIAKDGEVKDSLAVYDIFVSARSYGGTERIVNDKYVIEDTLDIETWYRPDITSDCQIRLWDDGSLWEILNTPEDIERMHQFMKFKCRRVKGNA